MVERDPQKGVFLDALKALDEIETGTTTGIPQVRVIESTKGFVIKNN